MSALRFARDAADWKWWHGSVPSTLRRLHGEGHLLVVLSNQAGIELHPDVKHSKRLKDFKQRSTAVLTQLDLPMAIYAATAHDKYRKPRTDMWTQMLEDHDLKHEDVDHGNSIFVGDAGGRIQNGKLRKDFSCSDRDFADNVGIRYQSPEEFFLNEEPRPFLRDFDPAQYLTSPKAQQDDGSNKATSYAKINDIDIVLLCGSPGAGKSTFYWNALKPLGYERVNQDILKSVCSDSFCSLVASLRCCVAARTVSANVVTPSLIPQELTPFPAREVFEGSCGLHSGEKRRCHR